MSETAMEREVAVRPRAAARPPARRRLAATALALLIAVVAWYGARWWTVGRFVESTDDAYVGANTASLAPHVAGFVQLVLVADNAHVRAGQLLVRLDPRDYRAAFDHASAAVGARSASLDILRAQLAMQQSTIRQQEAELASKSAAAVFSAQEADRYRALARTVAGTRQDMQRATALDQEERASVVGSTAALQAARQQVQVLTARVAEAGASLGQARSDLVTATLNLGYTGLRAPIDGYVGNRAAQVGAYVAAGEYLMSIVPDAGLWVDANFKEDQLARMQPGQPARVVADAIPGHEFSGRLVSVAPATGATFSVIPPENATGNFTKIVQRVPVRIALDAADPKLSRLRPGLSTTVSIDTRAGAETTR